MRRLGWKAIEELIDHESKLMVSRSINGLAPQYMSDLFTKISQLARGDFQKFGGQGGF